MRKVVQWSLSTKLFYSLVSNAAILLLVLWNNQNISRLTAEWKKKTKPKALRVSGRLLRFPSGGRQPRGAPAPSSPPRRLQVSSSSRSSGRCQRLQKNSFRELFRSASR